MSLSYSRIASFDKGGAKTLVVRHDVSNDGSKMGLVIDDLLFDEESFHEKYFIFDGVKPTATLGSLCDIIIQDYDKIPSDGIILKIIQQNNFWSSVKNRDVLIGKYNFPEFYSYIGSMIKIKNKNLTLITTEEYALGCEIRDILLTHKHSKYILNSNYESQYKFEITYNNFLIRGIVDILQIDHDNKTIRLIDLKTGHPSLLEFSDSFIKWRYFLQEAVYMIAAEQIKKDMELEDYTILPFQFLYISRFEKIPFVYEVSDTWHIAALDGFKIGKYKYKGLNELLDDIKWHLDNQKFDLPRDIYDAGGFKVLEDNFLTLIE